MTSWTAALCELCWNEMEPDHPVPPRFRILNDPPETCVNCGTKTFSGIYRRIAPAEQKYPKSPPRVGTPEPSQQPPPQGS